MERILLFKNSSGRDKDDLPPLVVVIAFVHEFGGHPLLVQRSASALRSAPLILARPQRQAMVNDKVEKLQATVAQ